MKPRILSAARLSYALASALAALLSTQGVHAGTIWDAGGGATTSINTASNWDGTAPGVVNALNGTTAATFGTAGSTATINVAASFTGITINRDAAFTIADGAGALTLGTGGITVTLPNTTARAHTISESSLILNGNQSWTVTNNTGAASLNVSSLISETGGARNLTKAGTGTLTLSGASGNTYTGLTTISAGVLRITKNEALGTVAGGVSVASGSGLQIDGTGGALTVGAEAISIAGGGVTLPTPNLGAIRNIAGNNTYGGTVTMTAQSRINSDSGTLTLNNATAAVTGAFTLVVGGAGNVTISTPMTNGAGGVSKDGAGTLTLSGLNTFTGNVSVSAGILAAGVAGTGGNSALGSVVSTRTITVNTGGTLRFDVGNVFNNNFASASTSVPALNIAGGTVTNGGTATNSALGNITLAGGTLTATLGSASGYGSWNLNGTVTSTGTSTISSTAGFPITLSAAAGTTTTFDVTSGTLTASAALGEVTAAGDERVSGFTKIGAGTLVLSGVNTYTGNAAINGGAVSIATTNALPGYITNGRYSVASGATLAVQNAVSEVDIAAMLGTTNFLSGSNLGFDTTAGDRTVLGNLADTAQGPLGIVKLGANTLTLSGTNAYTGPTTILAGALYLGGTGSLPNWNVNGGFSLASGASLIIPNTVSEAEVTTILGSTNVASGATLLFDTSLGDRTYTSAITNSAQGLLNIGKIGTNALTLAGANTHTGNTTLTSGTLNITGSLTGLAASSNFAYGNTPGNTIVNVSGSGSVNDYKNFTGANVAGSIAIMNQTGGSTSTLGTNGQDTQWVAQNGGYGYLNVTGGTFNTGRFDAVGITGGGTAVVYVGGTGTFNNNSGDWLILPRKEGVGQLTVGPGGSLVRTAAVTSPLGITMDGSNAHGALNIAGGNVDTSVRAIQFGFGSAAFTNTRGFVNLAGGTLSVGAAINQTNTAGQYFDHFNFGGGTLKSNAAMTWLPAVSAAGHTITATLYGSATNNNNANAAFNTQIGTSSNFTGGLTIDTNNFATTIAYPLSGAGGVGVTQADIGDVSLLSGNSGYIGAPAVVFSPPTAPGGVPASGYAVIDVGTGTVNGIVITNPGTYAASETPTITLTGGGGSIAPFPTLALATPNTSGGLTKTGAGVLTLSGASTYTGVTAVNVGTLNLTGSLASNVTVANDAVLIGEGSTTGSLVFSGSSFLGFDPVTPGRLTAGSANATGAAVTVLPTTAPTLTTGIVVLEAAGGITGLIGSEFVYTGRGSLTFNGGNTQLLLDTSPVSLAWSGNDGTNPTFWDLHTTTNWLSGGGQKFFTGDGVTFNDFAASFVVDINAANVFPGNINFINDANYTIQGAFGIYGSGTLTKGGIGKTVMNTSNGYTGLTTVTAGVLNIRTATALGDIIAGTSIASGGALEIQGGITTVAEALTLNGSGVLSGGALRSISGNNTWGTAVALASASTIGVDADTLTLPSLTGAFGLTKAGAGTLNITGTTAVTSATVEAGTLYMGAQTGPSTTTTLGAGSAVTLNGSGNLTIRRTNTGSADVTGAIGGTGTGSLTLIGDNTVTSASGDFLLNNTSTYSGGTTITGARVQYKAANALGTGPITTGPNGQVFFDAGMTLTNNFTLGSGLGWNESSGFLGALRMNSTTISGTIALTADTRLTSAGTSTLSGVISGGFGLDFFEDTVTGTIALSGDNTYTGPTTIGFGALNLQHANALGTTASGTTVASGARVALDGITVAGEAITVSGTGGNFFGALQGRSGTSVWAGNVTIGATDTRIGAVAGASLEVSGTIDDGVNDYRVIYRSEDSTATVIVSGANTYTGGTSLFGGSVIASSLNSVVGGTPTSSLGAPVTAANGMLIIGTGNVTGTLRYVGAGETTDRTVQIGANAAPPGAADTGGSTIENNGTTGALSFSAPVFNSPTNAVTGTSPTRTLTLGGSNAGANTISGIIQNNQIAGAPTAAVALTKTGAGSWTLPAANTYTGTTTIDQGTLAFTTTDPALAGGLTFGATVGGTNSGTLDLSGIASSATFAGAALVRTNNVTANTVTLAAAKTLTLNGGLTIGYAASAGAATDSKLTVNAGSMAVNGTNLIVGLSGTGAANSAWFNRAVLDVTSLASFTTDVTNLNVGVGDNIVPTGSLLLSNTANTILATTLKVGDTGGDNGKGTSTLTLGTGTNVIQADAIEIGKGKNSGPGVVTFTSQAPASPGTVTIANRAGTGAANITVANVNGVGTAGGSVGTLDLRGHLATVNAGTLVISQANNNTASISGTTGTVSFDEGTFTVATLNMAPKTGSSTGTANATLNVGGGTFAVSTAFTLGSQTGAGASVATVNLTGGGSLNSSVSILKGAGTTTSTINLDGGTLDLNGNAIGSGSAAIILNAKSGTLSNVATINGTGGLTKTTAGTLVVEGTDPYSGDTIVTEGTLTLSDAAGALNANTINDLSTVTIAATGATLDLAFTGTDVVNKLFFGAIEQPMGTYSASSVPPGATIPTNRFAGGGTLTVNTGSVGGFAAWAATGTLPGTVTFGGDLNGDGVQDGMAFLLGVANPDDDANGNLPTVTESGGNLTLTFNCLPTAGRGTAQLRVAHSSTLASFTATVDQVPDANDPVADNNVTFVVDTVSEAPLNKITATINAAAAAGGKLMGRLQATE
jgi:autotransporter-associated beta strand protein